VYVTRATRDAELLFRQHDRTLGRFPSHPSGHPAAARGHPADGLLILFGNVRHVRISGCSQYDRRGHRAKYNSKVTGRVRIEYELHQVEPFLTADDLEQMTFELDIGKLELFRTHWAVKEVNLPKELHVKGISLPPSLRDVTNAVDISRHIFDVALSFPGEARPLVEKIAPELERRIGPNAYFYDNNYVSQLAQPSLDTLLQGVYSRATLDVVFLSTDYQKKDWCGVEFRAVREIIFARENNRVMFVRTDDGVVDGVFKTAGYVDARKFEPAKIAEFICQRLDILRQNIDRGTL
jgi:hypothetical protein